MPPPVETSAEASAGILCKVLSFSSWKAVTAASRFFASASAKPLTDSANASGVVVSLMCGAFALAKISK